MPRKHKPTTPLTPPLQGDSSSIRPSPHSSAEGKKEYKGNPAAAREAAFTRRRFIYEKVKRETRLKLAEINARFGPTSKDSIREDISFFRKLGIQFKLVDINDSSVIVDEGMRYGENEELFQALRTVEKKIVAKLAYSLITGTTSATGDNSVQKDILQCLNGNLADLAKIRQQLVDYWRETSRLIAIDSSTTNEEVAALLTKLELPSADSNLSYLSACTNSRSIFNLIGAPDVRVRAIITGGQQRGRSVTIAGAMTEFFLREAILMHFGIALVSAIGIDLVLGRCIADTQEDMLVKQQFLTKAVTRVIIVDNSKLKMPSQVGGFPFASLTPKQVDLVITNGPLKLKEFQEFAERRARRVSSDELAEQKKAIEMFPEYVKALKGRGVGVLVGTTAFTEHGEYDTQDDKVNVEVTFTDDEMKAIRVR